MANKPITTTKNATFPYTLFVIGFRMVLPSDGGSDLSINSLHRLLIIFHRVHDRLDEHIGFDIHAVPNRPSTQIRPL